MNSLMKLKAVFLLGTLKPSEKEEFSHTQVLCELLQEELVAHDVESEIIRLVDHNISPGIKSNMGVGDEWPSILEKLFSADIIIFATPIWWGGQSSLIQRVMERLDELNETLVQTGKSELLNKVGGMVITGAEDGAQHVIGNISNFMVWNGLTLPPACSLSYLGNYADTPEVLREKFKSQSYTSGMARTMARNLAFVARLLKDAPIPTQEKDAQNIRG